MRSPTPSGRNFRADDWIRTSMERFRAPRAWSAAAFLNRATSASQTGVQGFEPCGAALETAARLMLLTTGPAASPG